MADIEDKDHAGLCKECRKIYCWVGSPVLRNARCPEHGTPLSMARQTSVGRRVQQLPAVAEDVRTC